MYTKQSDLLKTNKMRNDQKGKYLIILFSQIFCNCFFCQQSILLNQSAYNLYTLGPAALASTNETQVNLNYKKNWLGIAESPEAAGLTVSTPLSGNKCAAGFIFRNERWGIFSTTSLLGSFRYRLQLAENHNLSFGLSAGFKRQLSDFSKIKAENPEEFAQWPTQQAATIPDAACGLMYSHKRFQLMITINQILKSRYEYTEPVHNKKLEFHQVPDFSLLVQHAFDLKKEVLEYKPTIIIRSTFGLPVQLDFFNGFKYDNKLHLGAGYRTSDAFYASVGYGSSEKFRVIYSYEYCSAIQSINKGGHEIGIMFAVHNRTEKTNATHSKLRDHAKEELYEKLEEQGQQVAILTKEIDSLDSNLQNIRKEVSNLRSKQVTAEELATALEDKGVSSNLDGEAAIDKYKIITINQEKESIAAETLTAAATYKVVFGVYKILTYAKEYQRFLKRQVDLETHLVQLPDHPKKFIYVCFTSETNDLSSALKQLKELQQRIRSAGADGQNGDAWILQTIKK
jgi:type IX secretion system PorP/SprF family membrane protein